MRTIKRGLAILLAVLLIIPAMPVSAEGLPEPTSEVIDIGQQDPNEADKSGDSEDNSDADRPSLPEETPEVSTSPKPEESPKVTETPEESIAPEPATTPEAPSIAVPTSIPEGSASPEASVTPEANATASPEESAVPSATITPSASVSPSATPSTAPAVDIGEADEILYNTGNHAYSVVTKEAFDQEMGDAFYEADGSYTINIPEENPFFPYEVQFTCDGEVESQWFMTPDDSVEVGGHIFYVSAYFDGTVVTQLSLDVAGDTIIVWPEEKEFTDEEDGGIAELSLLPLTEKRLSVDLSAYTPAELTMVSVASIFTGNDALQNTDKVAWTYASEDDYTISESGSRIDLSRNTTSTYARWEMIVGDADQLTADNTRYIVGINLTNATNWLTPTVYVQDDAGNRSVSSVAEYYYNDYNKENRRERVTIASDQLSSGNKAYVSLSINPSVFGSTRFSDYKIYEGKYSSAAEAASGTDITAQICSGDMGQPGAGYLLERYTDQWVTMVTFDAAGQVTGCLPFYLYLYTAGNYLSINLYDKTGSTPEYVYDSASVSRVDGWNYETITLYKGYAASKDYYLTMNYYKAGNQSSADVTAAYVGQYSSIAEAVSAGAADIKDTLCKNAYSGGGYAADYSRGIYFTVFVGADGSAGQEIYRYNIKTVEGTNPKSSLYSGTVVWFTGMKDGAGNSIASYTTEYSDDSYSENNYVTMIVDPAVDLTNLAPEFNTATGVNLYTAGNSTTEVSGVSVHDFSKGAVQYTAASEDGNNQRNYWLQVIKAESSAGKLYLNSLADKESNTREENGIIYSTRQVMLDGYHNYIHDILLINIGKASIPSLSVELASDAVQLDEYWTLNGNRELSGFTTTSKAQSNGELPNLAKIRLKAKDGVANGAEVTGTLTIKSAGNTLMVLTLTGTIGDPCIITDEIPQAVKYVPYGSMIQNNNKYSWNQVSYRLVDGALPGGMIVKPNGEVYGVPTEAGDFTFTVEMRNSQSRFNSSIKTYTLTVLENTDPNVDGATDTGYDLSQRVQNLSFTSLDFSSSYTGRLELPAEKRTLVSQGIYGEFVDIYLDGNKLTEGTDYISESGSTRITILTQTLVSRSAGTHTLGVEFRTSDTDELKRAAQNYVVDITEDGGSSGNGDNNDEGDRNNSDGGSGSDGDSDNSNSAAALPNTSLANGKGAGNSSGSSEDTATTIAYTVESGDSLWKIAKKFFGDGNFWRKIYAENSEVIGSNPNKIQVGMVLTIYLNQGDGSMITAVSADGTTRNTYTVQRGDTLWKIALKVYGRGWRWRKIYDANTDKLSDPGQIYVGQVLFIPD